MRRELVLRRDCGAEIGLRERKRERAVREEEQGRR
jgi:hypothetical protein